jgi:hypothetical protein
VFLKLQIGSRAQLAAEALRRRPSGGRLSNT